MRRRGGRRGRNGLQGRGPEEEIDRARRAVAARGADVLEARRRVLRRGSGAAIHDLRVATRRLQAALEVYGPRLPERPRRRLDRRARRIRRQMGQARNARVLHALLRRLSVPAGGDEGRLVAGLLRRLDRSARTKRGTGRKPLPGIKRRIRALLQALAGRTKRPQAPAARPAGAPDPAGTALTARVEAVARAVRVAGDGDPESMHRLRIGVKRYRYVLEVLQESGAAGLEPSILAARSLQKELGRLHDLDVLIDWVRGATRDPAAGPFLRRLLRLRGGQLAKVARRLALFRPAGTGGIRRTAA